MTCEMAVKLQGLRSTGYILDVDQHDPDQQYEGFDLNAIIGMPQFAAWFHNPYPQIAGSEAWMKKIWVYATTGVGNREDFEKATSAVAYTYIDHVFFPLSKFKQGFYFDEARNQATNQGLEAVLHEALHIWDSRNHNLVLELLKSSGSYYDRVTTAKQICPVYATISSWPEDRAICGFATELGAMLEVLRQAKWPQRYGSLTERKSARIKDRFGCASVGRESTLEGEVVCLGENKGGRLGDLHALDNEQEYFAILMQLYVFSPVDFAKVATPMERQFAEGLSNTVWH